MEFDEIESNIAAFRIKRSAWYRNNAATAFSSFGGTGRVPRR